MIEDKNLERSLNKALFHRCNVYHIVKKGTEPSYGIPLKTKESFTYNDTPDITDVYCYFGGRVDDLTDTKDAEPNREVNEQYKVYFKPDEDIRLNDKFVYEGQVYTAGLPRLLKAPRMGVVTSMVLTVIAKREGNV